MNIKNNPIKFFANNFLKDKYLQIEGGKLLSGNVKISGSLTVSGQTLLDSYYTGSETLIVSGAMKIVDQQVGSAVASSSLFLENLGTIGNKDLSGVIDLGDGFQ